MTTPKNMTNDQLFRALVNSQSLMKTELLGEIKKLDKSLSGRINSLESETKKGFKAVNNRIDMLGKQLNVLDEDAPTGEEFKSLSDRVTKLENLNFVTA